MTEFISLKYGNDGYEVIIKTDKHEHYKAAEDFARQLIDHAKPKTNADHIRSMRDEELAEWIVLKTQYQESAFSNPSYLNLLTGMDDDYASAIKGALEWLQQPWEET